MKKNLFSNNRIKETRASVRPSLLRLENLEDRQMLSVTDVASLAAFNSSTIVEAAPATIDADLIDVSSSAEAYNADDVAALAALGIAEDDKGCVWHENGYLVELTISQYSGESLNIAFNKLEKLFVKDLDIKSINIENCPALESIECHNNSQLTDCSIVSSKLRSINLSNNNLENFSLSGNQLSSRLLKTINVANNNLTTLDVSMATGMQQLSCYGNNIKSLDLRAFSSLNKLSLDPTVDVVVLDLNNPNGAAAHELLFYGVSSAEITALDGAFNSFAFQSEILNGETFAKTTISGATSAISIDYNGHATKINPLFTVEQYSSSVYNIVDAGASLFKLNADSANLANIKFTVDSLTVEETATFLKYDANTQTISYCDPNNPVVNLENGVHTLYIACEGLGLYGEDASQSESYDFTVASWQLPAPTIVATPGLNKVEFSWTVEDDTYNPEAYIKEYSVSVNGGVAQTVVGNSYVVEGIVDPVTIEVTTISAYDDILNSSTASETATPIVALATPGVTVADTTTTYAEFAWDAVPNAASYAISYTIAGVETAYTDSTTETSFKIFAPADTEVAISVVAKIAQGETAYVDSAAGEASAKTDPLIALATPVVTAAEKTTGSVKFTWGAVENVAEYAISYTIAGDNTLYTATTTDTNYTINAAAKTGVAISVVAKAAADDVVYKDSEAGTAESATNDFVKLSVPSITVGDITTQSVNFYWDAVDGAAYYKIKYTTGDDFTEIPASTTETNYTINAPANSNVCIYVKAMAAEGDLVYVNSDWNYSGAVTNDYIALATPVVTVAYTTTYGVGFQWDAVENSNGYEIFYKVEGYDTNFITAITYGTTHQVNGPENTPISFKVVARAPLGDAVYKDSAEATAQAKTDAYVALATPVVTVTETTTSSVTFAWDAVEGAAEYAFSFTESGDDIIYTGTTTDTVMTFAVAPNTEISLSVVAKPASSDIVHKDSEAGTAKGSSLAPKAFALTDVVEEVRNKDLNADVATVSITSFEETVNYSIFVNGAESDAFSVVNGKLKYVKQLPISNTPYEIKVVASDSNDSLEATATVTIYGKLLKAQLEAEKVTAESFFIKWKSINNADGYTVAIRKAGDVAYEYFNTTSLGGTITELEPSTEYTVRVRANGSGSFLTSDWSYITVTTLAPSLNLGVESAKVNRTASDVNVATCTLDGFKAVAFTAKINGETTDAIEVVNNKVVYKGGLPVVDEGYAVEIVATNAQGETVSDSFTLYVAAKLAKCQVTAEQVGTAIVVDWQDYANTNLFRVQYKAEGDAEFTEVTVNESTFKIVGPKVNVPYTIRVKAIAMDNVSLNSDSTIVTATTVPKKLPKPQTTVEVVGYDVNISWKAVSNAIGYRIQWTTIDSKTFKTVDLAADQFSFKIAGIPDGYYKIRVKAIGTGSFKVSDGTYSYVTIPNLVNEILEGELADDVLEQLAANLS